MKALCCRKARTTTEEVGIDESKSQVPVPPQGKLIHGFRYSGQL
jgi:hypothetical protein